MSSHKALACRSRSDAAMAALVASSNSASSALGCCDSGCGCWGAAGGGGVGGGGCGARPAAASKAACCAAMAACCAGESDDRRSAACVTITQCETVLQVIKQHLVVAVDIIGDAVLLSLAEYPVRHAGLAGHAKRPLSPAIYAMLATQVASSQMTRAGWNARARPLQAARMQTGPNMPRQYCRLQHRVHGRVAPLSTGAYHCEGLPSQGPITWVRAAGCGAAVPLCSAWQS